MAREDKVDRGASARAARNRLLPSGRVTGPMPWVIAIMMFLTVLATAVGLGLGQGIGRLETDLSGRATVQVVIADAEARQAASARIVDRLRRTPGIGVVRRVDPITLANQLRPWLGDAASEEGLPMPALIDVDAGRLAYDDLKRIVQVVEPRAHVEPHAGFLQPLADLVRSLTLIAALVVLLMALATSAVVVLAARAAHEAHRGTIEVLHQMGATDAQLARLFQRRIALDAFFGGALGFVLAAAVIMLIGQRFTATGSELLQSIALPWTAWVALAVLPLGGVLLATIAARLTVMRALARTL